MGLGVHSTLPLNASWSEVRLLSINPSEDWDAPLECELSVVSLDDRPRYTTLSYCWGRQTAQVELCVNGFELAISPNLDDALRHVRELGVRHIWVDQISVNQQDFAERNSQILLMHRIYAGSRKCFAYLGKSEHTVEQLQKLFRFLKSLKGNPFDVELDLLHSGGREIDDVVDQVTGQFAIAPFLNSRYESSEQRMMFELIAVPYFSRIWVLQELIFSKKITCLWGRTDFDWKVFNSVTQYLPLRQSLALNTAFKRIPAASVWNTSALAEVNRRTKQTTDPKAEALERFTSFAELIESFTHHPNQGMLQLLHATRSFNATDDRDKIFALLNIACDKKLYPPADYRLSMKEVYSRFAHDAAQQGDVFNLIVNAGLANSADQSWIPDWSVMLKTWNFEQNSNFTAGILSGRKVCRRPRSLGSRLILTKHTFDHIQFVCPVNESRRGLTRKLEDIVLDAAESIPRSHCFEDSTSVNFRESLAELLFLDEEGGILDHDQTIEDEKLPSFGSHATVKESKKLGQLDRIRRKILYPVWTTIEKGQKMAYGLIDAPTLAAEALSKHLQNQEHWMRNDPEGFNRRAGFSDAIATVAAEKWIQHRQEKYSREPGVRGRGFLLKSDKNVLRRASDLELRIQELALFAVREKGVEYLKYLNNIEDVSRIIVTANGMFGLAPRGCQAGDHIAIIPGMRAPLILRQRDVTLFQCIGQAYIRGAMRGEHMPAISDDFQDVVLC